MDYWAEREGVECKVFRQIGDAKSDRGWISAYAKMTK